MTLNVNTSRDLKVASSAVLHNAVPHNAVLHNGDEESVQARLLLDSEDPVAQRRARAKEALAMFDRAWARASRGNDISTPPRGISTLTEPPIVETANASSIPQITKSELKRVLNHQLTVWLGEQTDAKGRASPSEGGTQDADRNNNQQPTNGTNRPGGKRKAKEKEKVSSTQDNQENDDGDDDDDDDISSSGRGKRPRHAEDSQTNGPKLLACPFGKTYPQSFSCCVERGFKDTSRVKSVMSLLPPFDACHDSYIL